MGFVMVVDVIFMVVDVIFMVVDVGFRCGQRDVISYDGQYGFSW